MSAHIPYEFDCPVCCETTRGHAVSDVSRALCRECFREWISSTGATLEERIESLDWQSEKLPATEIARRMRAVYEALKREEHEHWIELFGSIVAAVERALEVQAYGDKRVDEERRIVRAEVQRRTPYALNMINLLAWLDARIDGAP